MVIVAFLTSFHVFYIHSWLQKCDILLGPRLIIWSCGWAFPLLRARASRICFLVSHSAEKRGLELFRQELWVTRLSAVPTKRIELSQDSLI